MLVRMAPNPPRPGAPRRWVVGLRGRPLNEGVLRKELTAREHPARPDSAEQIAQALVEDAGPIAAAGRLLGDWSFTATDAWTGDRWLVRDAMGVAEAAWAVVDGALLAGRAVDVAAAAGLRAPDREALGWWLAAGAVPPPLSPWAGVSTLPAGCALRVTPDGRASVEAWHTPPPSAAGWGNRTELERWAASLWGAFQVAVLHRLEGSTALVESGDLDDPVGSVADGRGRAAFPRVAPAEEPMDLDRLCREGPIVAPGAAALAAGLLRARAEGHTRVVVGAGGAAIAGYAQRGLREALAGLLRGPSAPWFVDAGLWPEAPSSPDASAVWTRPGGPPGWSAALAGSRGSHPHALSRLIEARSALAPGIARASEVSGVEACSPWMSPSVEALCAAVPAGVRSPPGRPGALIRAAFPDARPPREAAPLPAIAPEAVCEALDGWADPRAVREALRARGGSADLRAWRLATAAAWRRGGTVS